MTTTEAEELGHASVVAAAFFDGVAIITKSTASKSKRRRSSPTVLRRGQFKDFLERAGHEIQHAHDAGIARHGQLFDEGDGLSREMLLSIAIDMHISVLRILEVACEHEKDTRLLDHMHDIADSNRHIAVKALNDLSARLDNPALKSPHGRISTARFLATSSRSLSSEEIAARLSTAPLDQSNKHPIYAPHLAKLKAATPPAPDIVEEARDPRASVGHITVQSRPDMTDVPPLPTQPSAVRQDGSTQRRDRKAVLPYRWLRAMCCMRDDNVEGFDATGPRIYNPKTKISTAVPTSTPCTESHQPETPIFELPGDRPVSDPSTIPAIAELDNLSTASLPTIISRSTTTSSVNTTPQSHPDTPATMFSDASATALGKPPTVAQSSPAALSPILSDITTPLLPSTPAPSTGTGVFCPGSSQPDSSDLDLVLLPGARTLSTLTNGALPPPTLHWRCTHCNLTSPPLACKASKAITKAAQLHDAKPTLRLPDEIIIHRGICYRWRFLVDSHLVPDKKHGERYGCVFCAAAGSQIKAGFKDDTAGDHRTEVDMEEHDLSTGGRQGVDVNEAKESMEVEAFACVDDYLRHVNEVHAGELSEDVQKMTKCVDGRIADEEDLSWDINICLFE